MLATGTHIHQLFVIKPGHMIMPVMLSFILFSSGLSADTSVVGAGNAQCSFWNNAEEPARNEIISWMMGFASALNYDFASSGQQEYNLQHLTYDYLAYEINKHCQEDKNQTMLSILLKALNNLPSYYEYE